MAGFEVIGELLEGGGVLYLYAIGDLAYAVFGGTSQSAHNGFVVLFFEPGLGKGIRNGDGHFAVFKAGNKGVFKPGGEIGFGER
jgi:hypothetical protein